jgi:hypothetical protein
MANLFGGGGWDAGEPGTYDMDDAGIVSVSWRPGCSQANATAGGLVSINSAVAGPLALDSNKDIESQDGTDTITFADDWTTENTTYDLVVTWDAASDAFDLYRDGTKDADADTYTSDAWDKGTLLGLGFDNDTPMHFKNLKIYNEYSDDGGLPAAGASGKLLWILD